MISPDVNGSPWVASHWALAGPIEVPLPECPMEPAAPPLATVRLCAGWLVTPAKAHPDGIRETLFQIAQALLLDPERAEEIGRHTRARLQTRGLAEADLPRLPLGMITTRRAMSEELRSAGYASWEIRNSRLLSDPRLLGRVIGPIRDAEGLIVSFWAWQPDALIPRYLFLNRHWRRLAPLVGLETALHAAGSARHGLVVVEDPLDALLLRARGMENVAAIAGRGRELSAWCWRRLAELGVERVTLVLDDHPGALASLAAARQSHRAVPEAPELFFVLTERLAPWASPGELVRVRGIEALRALLDQAWRLADAAESEEARAPDEATHPRADVPGAPKPGRCALHGCGETDCFCFD